MKIAVCLKQVVTRETHVRLDASGTWIREDEASWALNEPDGYALEEALRLKEQHGLEVVAVAAGPARVVQVVRDALARGADRGVHVETASGRDPMVTASALAGVLAAEQCDLILTGLQSDDHGFAQVGVMLAEKLDIPHATIVVNVEIDGRTLRVKRELEGGWFQWIAMDLPALVTIQSGINQLRYPTLAGIKAARRKDILTVAAGDGDALSRQRIVSLRLPEARRRGRLLGGTPAEAAAELVRALREDARVE